MNNQINTSIVALEEQLRRYSQNLENQKLGLVPTSTSFLKCLSEGTEVKISACDGTLLMKDATNIFPGNIDGDFENFGLNVPQAATPETLVRVFEITRDGLWPQFFTSFNHGLYDLALTRMQIAKYVEENSMWLHPKDNSTLFLTEENDEFFLVYAYYPASERGVGVYRFDDGGVWKAVDTYRLVVPQYVPVVS